MITKKSKLAEVLAINGSEEILLKFGVPCLGCPMAQYEMGMLTLEQICDAYGIDAEALVKELNKLSKEQK